ncbi:MAG TPA: SAM-dependent methyltransferase [Alphaproteobacteria bacterium]|nr:SAM-dependent methyltransferase [Alphaproteobacteria bacterium]
MTACLTHPEHGFYTGHAGRDPIGRSGDFVTAPEISQIFGELIGAWCIVAWEAMGRPEAFALVELGPGRGTMLADALRAARIHPEFLAAARVHLVEASPALRAVQERTLGGYHPAWLEDLGELAPGPMLLLANEFFDVLPVEQFVCRNHDWKRRVIVVDGSGALALSEAPESLRLDSSLDDAAEGTIAEMSPAVQATAFDIGGRLRDHPGYALVLDYGREGALGESLQAVRGHRPEPPLANPGEADLSAHVDFRALNRAATLAGANVFGPVAQGEFLKALGAEARAEALGRAEPTRRAEIALALARLTGARAMGRLFQAVAIASPGLPVPPGFERANAGRGAALAPGSGG